MYNSAIRNFFNEIGFDLSSRYEIDPENHQACVIASLRDLAEVQLIGIEEKEYIELDKEHRGRKRIDDDFTLCFDKHYFSLKQSLDIFSKLIHSEFEEDYIVLKGSSLKLLSTLKMQ